MEELLGVLVFIFKIMDKNPAPISTSGYTYPKVTKHRYLDSIYLTKNRATVLWACLGSFWQLQLHLESPVAKSSTKQS